MGQRVPAQVSVQEYISRYKEVAIRKMKEHRIPASITLAQGILESANGNSDLAVNANNHFGIKCHEDWDGEAYYKDDDEKNECFRKYRTPDQSFEDHTRFLCSRPRYAFLFELKPTDYKEWAYGLKKAGYATNPQYPQMLIKIIEDNRLFEFDHAGDLPFGEQFSFTIDSLPKEYKEMVRTSDAEVISFGVVRRQVYRNNRVKFTVSLKGDNIKKLAEDLDLMTWQICRYNELSKKDEIKQGQIIYIQPKRRRAEKEFHIVKPHETIYTISQLYGIKMKFLYRKNRMEKGNQPYKGQKLWLRSTKPRES
ncbi:MAG: glucosaminidase domain-containing protein [Bacteroidetes bacterium]|nr:glucosaminidase domain-containing protein [Bacteroidota bacterium]